MCGITGYINKDKKPVRDTSRILKMLKVQKHRGPDDSGIRAFSLSTGNSMAFNVNKVSLIEGDFDGIIGFNRLSILDLSANGHQPMISPDGMVVLTLNGEIYNAFDHKKDMEEWGYRFKSTTDTEVVLALYLKYGFDGMINRLNGMFAIVVADLKRKEIYIVRDRFGIKPMYYVNRNDIFAFSSELKSFKFLQNFNFSLNDKQLDEYLLYRSNIKGTLFNDVNSLEPGHYISYKQGEDIKINKFFNINDYSRNNSISGDISFYGKELEDWLSGSVERQLMSDVKLGCQLSGGVDSSLVTWLANRNSEKGRFESVSIVFKDQRFSEERYIKHVKETLDIPGHEFLMEPDYYLDHFEKATWHLEVPVNHPNTIGIYKLSQRAKEYVTVLLSGEGADEVFGGYGRFYSILFPFSSRRLLHEIKKSMFYPAGFVDYLSPAKRAIMATAFMTPKTAKMLLPGFRKEKAMGNRIDVYAGLSGSMFDKQVKYEMLTYLPDLLIRQDKMSMAHSIENRVPFLDNEIVERSFSIPEKYLLIRKSKEGYNTEKYLLKKMAANVFGKEFAFRNKMGFGIPVREFMTENKFADYLNDKLLPGIKQRGLFNYNVVSGWINKVNTLKYVELEALWVVISFEVWASVFLDEDLNN